MYNFFISCFSYLSTSSVSHFFRPMDQPTDIVIYRAAIADKKCWLKNKILETRAFTFFKNHYHYQKRCLNVRSQENCMFVSNITPSGSWIFFNGSWFYGVFLLFSCGSLDQPYSLVHFHFCSVLSFDEYVFLHQNTICFCFCFCFSVNPNFTLSNVLLICNLNSGYLVSIYLDTLI